MEEIGTDYGRRCRAARRLAEEFFDARQTLTNLTEGALRLG